MMPGRILALQIVLTISINSVLLACGAGISSGSFQNGSGEINIELPSSINQHLSKTMNIEALLTIDEKESYSLTINEELNVISGTLSKQNAGEHTLLLDYQVEHNGSMISIATASFSMTIASDNTTQVVLKKFTYTDSDLDGISNIAEINFQTDPFNSTEKPDMNGVHSSSNYVLNENINNPATAETAKAMHYTVQ